MNLRAVLLSPFTLVHAIILKLRHVCYDLGIFPSVSIDHKLLKVGNLAFGGTGKTPFTEYLIRMLQDEYHVGVISRGYGRKDSLLREVEFNSPVEQVGDEPLQIKKKFNQIPVFVNRDRVEAIGQLRQAYPENELIVMDDALQHRRLKSGFQILLTAAQKPFTSDFLFPSGYLRDLKSRAKVADVIVVTKCDQRTDKPLLRNALVIYDKPIFFAGIEYNSPAHISTGALLEHKKYDHGIVLTGIASPDTFLDHLTKFSDNLIHLKFGDHYNYTQRDLKNIRETFEGLKGLSVIFTTEKDAMRLGTSNYFHTVKHLPIYVIKLRMRIIDHENEFKELIKNYA